MKVSPARTPSAEQYQVELRRDKRKVGPITGTCAKSPQKSYIMYMWNACFVVVFGISDLWKSTNALHNDTAHDVKEYICDKKHNIEILVIRDFGTRLTQRQINE